MLKLILFILVLCVSLVTHATVEFTVHHATGGPSDKTTRIITKNLPNDYVVVNRPGAQGKIAINYLIKNTSVMIATMPQIYVTNLLSDDAYSNNNLQLIGIVGTMPSILVCHSKHNFKTYFDFKNTTLSLNLGVAGYGSSEHLATEILLLQHKNSHQIIPYPQGGSVSLIDLLSGNIDCMFANYPLVKEHLSDRRIISLISSHDLGLPIPTWHNIFKTSFPFQSQLGVIVSSTMDINMKQRIVNDISVAFNNKQLTSELLQIGLFPILSTSNNIVSEALYNNNKLKELIIKNNIKLK